MNGHWFCSTCDDVVSMPAPVGRWDSLQDRWCPYCHHTTAFWVKDISNDTPPPRTVSPARAKVLFAKMRAEFEPGDTI